jgi:outer membrane protein assembly factor BamE (lipoprotein component of BamABCDE complex)
MKIFRRSEMTNRIKTLTALILGCIVLSGCIVVDDEFPAYSSYSYGNYEPTVDYYHRSPRYYVSNHTHITTFHTNNSHLDKPRHIEKHEPPKHINKHKHPDKKLHQPIKEKAPDISQHHTPKHDVVRKPEPIHEPLHKITVQNFSDTPKEHEKKQKTKIHHHK